MSTNEYYLHSDDNFETTVSLFGPNGLDKALVLVADSVQNLENYIMVSDSTGTAHLIRQIPRQHSSDNPFEINIW